MTGNSTVIGRIDDLEILLMLKKSTQIGNIYDRFSYPRMSSTIVQYKIQGNIYILFSKRDKKLVNAYYFGLAQNRKTLVLPSFWSAGHAGWKNDLIAVLKFIFNYLPKLKISQVQFLYRSNYKNVSTIEEIRKHFDWPQATITNYFGKIDKIPETIQNRWLQRELPIDVAIEHFTSSNLKELVASLKSPAWKDQIPPSLHPLQLKQKIDPNTSFLVKKKGEIIGWLICHAMGKNKLQVTSLHVKKSGASFIGLKLIDKMHEGLRNTNRKDATVTYMIESINEKMVHLTERILQPMGVNLHSIYKIEIPVL
jgi:hypothetical protein